MARPRAPIGQTGGEVVFNTSMTGYQEVLTDPSYAGQLVTMTCPEIGNYGVSQRTSSRVACRWQASSFAASRRLRAAGARTARWPTTSPSTTSSRSADIDTRALTRVLRSVGVMRGIIATGAPNPKDLVEQARALPMMEGADLVRGVTCATAFDWPDFDVPRAGPRPTEPHASSQADGVGAVGVRRDGGGHRGVRRPAGPPRTASAARRRVRLRHEVEHPAAARGARLRRARVSSDGARVRAAGDQPGRHLPQQRSRRSGGARLRDRQHAARSSTAECRSFGICLGHQILGLALGAKTFKLKFGHRGGNHPVKDLRSGKIEITSQNHGFAVDPASLPSDVEVTHTNLYDGTVEGLRHKTKPVVLRAVSSRSRARAARRGLPVQRIPWTPWRRGGSGSS